MMFFHKNFNADTMDHGAEFGWGQGVEDFTVNLFINVGTSQAGTILAQTSLDRR